MVGSLCGCHFKRYTRALKTGKVKAWLAGKRVSCAKSYTKEIIWVCDLIDKPISRIELKPVSGASAVVDVIVRREE